MKNALIALLCLLCVFLYIRGKNAGVSAPSHGESISPAPATVHTTAAETVAPKPYQPTIAQVNHDHVEARLAAMKEVAWRYAKFFAKAGLSREKADLLLDLLVDQKMVAVEADLQLSATDTIAGEGKSRIDEAARLDRKLIEELLGSEVAQDLYSSGLDQTMSTPELPGLQVISAQGPIPAESKPRIEQVLGVFNPQDGFDTILNGGQEVTATVEQRFREIQATRIESTISQLQGALTPDQASALRDWSRTEADKAIEFAKIFWIRNHRRG